MDGITSPGPAIRAGVTAGVLKDTTAGQVIIKTLDKLNAAQALSGPAAEAGGRFRNDVLHAAGIGGALDITV